MPKGKSDIESARAARRHRRCHRRTDDTAAAAAAAACCSPAAPATTCCSVSSVKLGLLSQPGAPAPPQSNWASHTANWKPLCTRAHFFCPTSTPSLVGLQAAEAVVRGA